MESQSTSPKPTEQPKDLSGVLGGWLRVWSRLYRRELTDEDFVIYDELLKDLGPEQLDAACRGASQKCTFFPTPAEIRAQVEQPAAKGFQVEAEHAWQWSLVVAQRCYYADLGGLRDAPAIPVEVEFAVKSAGGWRRLHMSSEDELVWCRKTFLERYTLLHETRHVEHLLGDGEAKRLLSQLTSGACVNQARVLEAPPPAREETIDADVAESLHRARESVNRPPAPRAQLSPEEIDRRKREQLDKFEKYLRERGQHAAETVAARAEIRIPALRRPRARGAARRRGPDRGRV